jgi:5-methylcytosine-specific restriction endonuclease McrA
MPALHRVHRGRSGRPWRRVRAYILERDGYRCWLCGRIGADTADHVIPLSKGGDPLDPGNLRAAHQRCNSRRQAALPQPVPSGATRRW